MLLPLQGVNTMAIRDPGCRFACPGLCATLGFQPVLAKSETSIINVQQRAKRAQPNKVLMLPSENYMLLALGTNLGDKRANIARALSLIGERIGRVIRVAEPIRTAPVDFTSDHTFLNTVAVVERQPDLSVDEVLRRTQEIERQMGRTLKSHEGIHYDRIMDIDLLMIGETHINRTDLTLPHPRIAERLFVLRPLAEVAPDVIHPEYGMTFKELLSVRERCHFVQLTEALCTPELLARVNDLLHQLSSAAEGLTLARLRALAVAPMTQVVLAYGVKEGEDEPLPLGMATLCLCDQPTGRKAWVEDVVIDAKARGRGMARALLHELFVRAQHVGARSVNLTSRPEREAANRLYQSLGMKQRRTNVYKHENEKSNMNEH